MHEKIRSARKEAGLTQQELAERAGLSPTSVSNLETGKHSPSAENLSKISSAVGKPLSYFDSPLDASVETSGPEQYRRKYEKALEENLELKELLRQAERQLEALRTIQALGYLSDRPSSFIGASIWSYLERVGISTTLLDKESILRILRDLPIPFWSEDFDLYQAKDRMLRDSKEKWGKDLLGVQGSAFEEFFPWAERQPGDVEGLDGESMSVVKNALAARVEEAKKGTLKPSDRVIKKGSQKGAGQT